MGSGGFQSGLRIISVLFNCMVYIKSITYIFYIYYYLFTPSLLSFIETQINHLCLAKYLQHGSGMCLGNSCTPPCTACFSLACFSSPIAQWPFWWNKNVSKYIFVFFQNKIVTLNPNTIYFLETYIEKFQKYFCFHWNSYLKTDSANLLMRLMTSMQQYVKISM